MRRAAPRDRGPISQGEGGLTLRLLRLQPLLAQPSRFHERVANAVTFKTCYCTPSDTKPLGNGGGVPVFRTYVLGIGTHPLNRTPMRASYCGWRLQTYSYTSAECLRLRLYYRATSVTVRPESRPPRYSAVVRPAPGPRLDRLRARLAHGTKHGHRAELPSVDRPCGVGEGVRCRRPEHRTDTVTETRRRSNCRCHHTVTGHTHSTHSTQ